MRRVYRFFFVMILCWVVILPIWNWLSPYYGKSLAVVASAIFQKNPFNDYELSYRFEKISIISNIYFSVTRISDGQKEYFEGSPSWDGRRFHFSFTIWAALMLATPFERKWGRKLLLFMIGWAAVFFGQLLSLFFQTFHQNLFFLQTLAPTQYYPPSTSVYLFILIGRYALLLGGMVIPFGVWLFVGFPQLKRIIEGSKEKLLVQKNNLTESAAPGKAAKI